MRISKKAFFSCSVLAGVLLAAAGATAADPPPSYECTIGGSWHVVASPLSAGPCPNDASATCTTIVYTINNLTLSGTDHVATLVRWEAASFAVSPQASSFFSAGEGDNLTGLGTYAQHEQAVRLNAGGTKNEEFALVVQGNRAPITTSLLIKKGKFVGSCRIAGIGFESSEIAPVTETLTHGNCAVEFTLDKFGGNVLSAKLTDASIQAGCQSPDMAPDGTLNPKSVEGLQLTLDGDDLGTGKFGDGYIQSGEQSCTTRIVGGKVYTWGSPCPQ